jgi:(hydroxyamino)benzene mutase
MKADISYALHGAVLIVLGLLAGFATAAVAAPNMALAAHTIGILEGTLCIALAFLWPVLASMGYGMGLTRVSLLIGFYSNWLGALLASVWSAKEMAFVTGGTMPDGAAQWQELVVAVLLNLSLLVLLGFIHVAYVLFRVRRQQDTTAS